MLTMLALLLPLDAVFQHHFRKSFFFFLYPQITLGQRTPLAGNPLIGKSLFQRYTGRQPSLAPTCKGNKVDVQMGRCFVHVQVS